MNFPSSSSSSSPPDLSVSLVEDCQVCGKPGHGNHFGAITCRACAAFFRRFGICNNFNYCNKNNKCRALRPGMFSCKHCRLKKCKMIGMTIDNFQFQRDSFFRKDREDKIPLSVGTFLGRSNLIIYSAPSPGKSSQRFLDVQFLVDKASDILKIGGSNVFLAPNSLEKLGYGLSHIRSGFQKNPENLEAIRKFGMTETFNMWESDLLKVAKWLTLFDEFQELPHHLKMKLLKGIWVVWSRFEKFESAAIDRRKNYGDWRKWKWESKNRVNVDLSWCSRYTLEELKFFGQTNLDQLYSMMQSMLELELTDVELSYMLCQLCFHHVGKRHQGEILEVCERLQDVLSNNLHDYYTKSLEKVKYSTRIASMMKFNNFIQFELYQRRVKMDLMKVFDVFFIEFSDPELFMDF